MTSLTFRDYDTRVAAYAVVIDEADRILLTFFNGSSHSAPGWTLPGGGVDFDESLEDAAVREVYEETGYHVALDGLLATSHRARPEEQPRPMKSVRIVYAAHVIGGTLGTIEVNGTTDEAAWIALDQLPARRAEIIDIGVAAWRAHHSR